MTTVRHSQLRSRLASQVEAARRLTSSILPPAAEPPVDVDDRSLLLVPTILGLLAILAITIGCALPASTGFTLKQRGAWYFGIPNPYSHQDPFLALVLVYGGLVLLCRVWYDLAKRLARHRGVPVAKLVIVFAIWTVPLLVAPPLFSKDVYSYAAQGDMVSHGINPYQYGPDVIGAGPFVAPVDQIWGNAPAPYGPLFLESAGIITKVTAHHELATVVGLRLLALLGVVLLAVFIPKLARLHGRDPSAAFALAVLNPLTLLHLIGGAHNEALMVGLLAAGLTLAKSGRPMFGVVCCALAAAVKAPAALIIVYIGWTWMGEDVPWRERIRPVVSSLLVGGAVMAFLSQVTGLGWGWLSALGTPGTVKSWLAPTTGIAILGGHITHLVGFGPTTDTLLKVAREMGLAAAAAAAAYLLLRTDRIGLLRAAGAALVLLVLLGPVVQPWYLAWGLLLLAAVAEGWVLTSLLWLSVVSAYIGLPGGRMLIEELSRPSPWSPLVGVLLVVAVGFTPLGRRTRSFVSRPRPPAALG
jgi:alpha-1,6-mannosyltransferase